jgi:cytochrome c-type biogenesis protein CcmH
MGAGVKWATWALIAGAAALGGAALVRSGHGADVAAAPPAVASADADHWRKQGSDCFDANDYPCAIEAWQHVVDVAPGDAVAWSALGESRVMASEHDPMPAAALDAFRRASAIDPHDPRAQYFLAVNKDLTGDHQGAITDWLALLGQTPPGAVWEKDLRRTIEQVGRINHIDVTARLATIRQPAATAPGPAGDMPGPSAQDLAQARSIPPSQQRTMAEAMVDRLETRLATDPHNADGWVMLIRSRMTLNQPDRARAALARAQAADPADAATIRDQAHAMGVD